MSHVLDAAEPARYTLLGLLLAGSRHGYDLARDFAPLTPLGDVVHLSPSHLYALLGRLERDGLLNGERQESGAHPPRRVYQLTEEGRATVLRWIDEPVTRPRDMHLAFAMKFYIACRHDQRRARALVEHQRTLFAAYLRDLEHDSVQDDGGTHGVFLALLREGRMGRTRAALAWLDRCAAAVTAVSAASPRDTREAGGAGGGGASPAQGAMTCGADPR